MSVDIPTDNREHSYQALFIVDREPDRKLQTFRDVDISVLVDIRFEERLNEQVKDRLNRHFAFIKNRRHNHILRRFRTEGLAHSHLGCPSYGHIPLSWRPPCRRRGRLVRAPALVVMLCQFISGWCKM